MDKKWNQMSLDEKMQWHRRHPWVMRFVLIVFAILILLIERIVF
jgi:hypothetical protein